MILVSSSSAGSASLLDPLIRFAGQAKINVPVLVEFAMQCSQCLLSALLEQLQVLVGTSFL